MKKPNNWDNTQAASEYKRPEAGGYVCKITKVTDVPDNEYLDIEFDIVEGEFKGYGADTLERAGWTPFKFRKYYSPKALAFFKLFINTIEETNNGFRYDFDERKLVNKGIGIVLQEVEYTKRDGSIGTRLEPAAFKTANEIRSGNFTVPSIKRKGTDPVQETFTPADDDDSGELPF